MHVASLQAARCGAFIADPYAGHRLVPRIVEFDVVGDGDDSQRSPWGGVVASHTEHARQGGKRARFHDDTWGFPGVVGDVFNDDER